MSPEKWEEIKTMTGRQFEVEEEGVEDLLINTAEGQVKQGFAEFVVFSGPMGRLKLQFQTKPKLESKDFHYSHRAGTSARIEYKFSEDEVVHTFKVYKYDDIEDDWDEIDASKFDS